MGISCIFVDRDDALFRYQPLFLPAVSNELLDVVFSDWLICTDTARYFAESFQDNAMGFVRSLDMRLLLCGRPNSFELLDELGARNRFDPKRANEFDCAG